MKLKGKGIQQEFSLVVFAYCLFIACFLEVTWGEAKDVKFIQGEVEPLATSLIRFYTYNALKYFNTTKKGDSPLKAPMHAVLNSNSYID